MSAPPLPRSSRGSSPRLAPKGIPVARALIDNGACSRAHAFAQTARQLGVGSERTRPYWPQTADNAEALIRTLLRERTCVRPYLSNANRLTARSPWLSAYNHSRPHTGLDGRTPAKRLAVNKPQWEEELGRAALYCEPQ